MRASWIVDYNDDVPAQIQELKKSGEITEEDFLMIREWIKQVKNFGPHSLRQTQKLSDFFPINVTDEIFNRPLSEKNFWNDHDLVGKWTGHRSSSYSRLGRIIYKIDNEQLKIVRVEKITPDHKY